MKNRPKNDNGTSLSRTFKGIAVGVGVGILGGLAIVFKVGDWLIVDRGETIERIAQQDQERQKRAAAGPEKEAIIPENDKAALKAYLARAESKVASTCTNPGEKINFTETTSHRLSLFNRDFILKDLGAENIARRIDALYGANVTILAHNGMPEQFMARYFDGPDSGRVLVLGNPMLLNSRDESQILAFIDNLASMNFTMPGQSTVLLKGNWNDMPKSYYRIERMSVTQERFLIPGSTTQPPQGINIGRNFCPPQPMTPVTTQPGPAPEQ